MKKSDDVQPIIVKKVKKVAGGHHGGAWKVAYADFVTAMMAFFLLLWLLNVSTKEALNSISNYFDPTAPKVSSSESGAGGVLGGLSVAPDGAMTSTVQNISQPQNSGTNTRGDELQTRPSVEEAEIEELEAELEQRENARFAETKATLEQAIQKSPELKDLADHLQVDITPEGLRIQIIDQDGEPMFASGSAVMFEKTQSLMLKVAELIKTLPNELSIRGHTDAYQYNPGASYTNWELSADRANATRRILTQGGLKDRISNVMGKADTEAFVKDKPLDARNRRMSIILLRQSLPEAFDKGEFGNRAKPKLLNARPKDPALSDLPAIHGAPTGGFQKTQGAVQFP